MFMQCAVHRDCCVTLWYKVECGEVCMSRVVDCPLSCSSSCKSRLNYDSCVCQNPSCAAFGSDSTPPELYFDLKVTIADHTDGISVRLLNQTSEAFLQCSVRRMLCAA